jgi:lysozyme
VRTVRGVAVITLPGVDVSSFNGLPGQWQHEAGAIRWAGVKFSELSSTGPYRNPDAGADWALLKAQGLGRLAYLFAHPGMPAASTVDLFMSMATALGLDRGDAVCVDLEVTDGRSPAQVAAWARSVCVLLERKAGRTPVLYTFVSFAREGNCAGLGRYPLWIADPSSPVGNPLVPGPWTTWAIHQYSITPPIDRDAARYPTLKAMQAALGKPAPKPPAVKPQRNEPMQLPAVTTYIAVSLPSWAKHVLFGVGAETAGISYQFHGQDWKTITLKALDGASRLAVPAGCNFVRVKRSETAQSIDVALEDS